MDVLSPYMKRGILVSDRRTRSDAQPLCVPERLKLISEPSPLERVRLEGLGVGEYSFYVKREDKTAELYGGNKVRNLEFVLGDAIAHKAEQLVTVGPIGSNFVAALSATCTQDWHSTYRSSL